MKPRLHRATQRGKLTVGAVQAIEEACRREVEAALNEISERHGCDVGPMILVKIKQKRMEGR